MAITASEQRAISKAMSLNLAAQVTRVRFGLYRVLSTTEHGVTWTVAIENGTYSCTCKASNKPACVHRAAVYLAKVEATGAKVVGVKPATRAARQPKPAVVVALPRETLERVRKPAAADLEQGSLQARPWTARCLIHSAPAYAGTRAQIPIAGRHRKTPRWPTTSARSRSASVSTSNSSRVVTPASIRKGSTLRIWSTSVA